MTTPCEVHLFASSQEKAREVATDILGASKKLESKYNFYNPDSYLSALNQRETNTLDYQTKEVLKQAKLFYTHTKGIFDVTVGTLKQSMQYKTIEEIEKDKERLSAFVGSEHFEIKRDKLHFTNPHTKIDLGGFIKEYAVDNAVKIVKKAKLKAALINFGGDIYALGRKPDGKGFKIGIKNPLNPKEYLQDVYLTNQALTTSASYERNQTVEGKTYSHIMHTDDLQSQILSASVISPTVVQSGVYSTALMVDTTLEIHFDKILIDQNLEIIT
ncbi:MAG: Thiamin biosynthesis lipoprotein ApbE [uncultured Sulfurovum sp.]|uniref:FAD:protein FMN transferase n=1 Tax=uncultured Sulfurovum sp. TaxID=269237 RepID=A0A6S6TRN9_9BACT|nr:MAG: Thiamin biosynthesis lipoprotein ApbE [uncultured Sulfurovum sp.]